MENSTIFRVQDLYGRGPWKPGFSHKWIVPREDHNNLVPWYIEHGNFLDQLPDNKHFGTGCLSIKQLRRWFIKAEYKKLQKFGYQAGMLKDCEIIKKSDIQCVFFKNEPLKYTFTTIKLY